MSAASFYGNEERNFTRSEVLKILVGLQGRSCSICGGYMERTDMTIDHVIPRSRGGRHDFSNWLLAHKRCNADKANANPSEREIEMISRVVSRLPKPTPITEGEK